MQISRDLAEKIGNLLVNNATQCIIYSSADPTTTYTGNTSQVDLVEDTANSKFTYRLLAIFDMQAQTDIDTIELQTNTGVIEIKEVLTTPLTFLQGLNSFLIEIDITYDFT